MVRSVAAGMKAAGRRIGLRATLCAGYGHHLLARCQTRDNARLCRNLINEFAWLVRGKYVLFSSCCVDTLKVRGGVLSRWNGEGLLEYWQVAVFRATLVTLNLHGSLA